MFDRIVNFFTTGVWSIQVRSLSGPRAYGVRLVRVVLLALRGFGEDLCLLQASALTYYSLLSIVPVAALAFGIAKGFGLQKMLEKQLLETLHGQEEMVTRVIGFAQSMLDSTRGGLIAGIGVVILFWTVVKLLGQIEHSFNIIWGVKQDRSFARKFSDYLSVMMICPVLLIMSGSATVVISAQVRVIVDQIALLGFISPLLFAALKLAPYCVIWIVFVFIYLFIPNTSVRVRSGIIAGICAGTFFQLLQWAYINFQIGVAKYNAIYGSFAALPLFLVWLQTSWVVVLFGAELAFAQQNAETYEFEHDCSHISYQFKLLLTLRIAHEVAKRFCEAQTPLSARQLSERLEIPIRLIRQILFDLVQCGVLTQAGTQSDRDLCYQPACSVRKLTVASVIERLEKHGNDTIPVMHSPELDRLAAYLNDMRENQKQSSANTPLCEL